MVTIFIPASDMKNIHPAPTCNTCPTREFMRMASLLAWHMNLKELLLGLAVSSSFKLLMNPVQIRAGFLGVVEFNGGAVLLYISCMHLVTKYLIKIWNFVRRNNR